MEIKLGNIVAMGIYNSQSAARGKAVSKNRKAVMYEIELPIERGGISYIDNEEIEILPDMIICAKPGQVRHTRFPFKCYYIHIIINDGLLKDQIDSTENFIKTSNYNSYREIFEKLLKYHDTALIEDEIMIQSLILELVYKISKESKRVSGGVKARANDIAIDRAIKYINDNLTSDLSLKTVSGYSGFSPIHFHNMFKAKTGKTLRDYVEEQRIKKAANMIISTNLTLTGIAYECGFSSQSYFSYAFKRKMGIAPREYAKNVFKKYEEE